MSKLSHSHQPTMDLIDDRKAKEDGLSVTECWLCGAKVLDGDPVDPCKDKDCPARTKGTQHE